MRWEKDNVRLLSALGGMVIVPFFQLIMGFTASNQGWPRIAFSFPPFMTYSRSVFAG